MKHGLQTITLSAQRSYSFIMQIPNIPFTISALARALILPALLVTWFATEIPVARAASGCDGAGNCYIYASATGSGTGASWVDAYKGFGTGTGKVNPAAMTRGVTYWIANGNYGAVNFGTPNSGTTVVNIQGATSASHGPASDWSSSFAGQALFTGGGITSDYWTFNGQSRGADWQSGYTIKFWNQSTPQGASMTLGTGSSGVSNINFRYVEFEGTGAGFPNNNSTSDKCNTDNCGIWMDNAIYENQPVSNLYVGYSYAHHTGNTQFQMNVTGPGGAINQTVTWEYNYISYNHTGQNGEHDEAFALLASNVIVRNNVFQDISGSGIICDASAAAPAMSNWYIYGNLFFNDPTYLALGQNYWLNTVDNGIVALGDGSGNPENLSGTFLFSNNTIANFDFPGVSGANVYSTLPISGVPGAITGNASVVIQNNLWYRSAFVFGNYNPICNQLSGTCTQDYNAAYQGDSAIANVNWQTQQNPASHDYNVSGTSSPFSSAQPATMKGYAPVTPDPFVSHAGVSLGSPYNVDAFGVVRGTNGTWDRGALQSGGTGSAGDPISTTTALTSSATTVTQGTSVTFTAKVAPSSGSTIPTGTVVFQNGSTTLGSAALNSSGTATYSTASLPVGTSSITASYGGSTSSSPSTSPAMSVSVTAASLTSTSTKISASATSIKQGASVSFTATVTASTGTAKPTGTVVFHNGSTTLGSVALNSSGTAVYSTATLPVGTSSITASYGGSSTNSASTSPAVSVSVAASSLISTTTKISASATSIKQGTSVSFTATVTASTGTAKPTGTVVFHNGSTTLGSVALNSSGTAVYSTTTLPVGTASITASYGGSSTNSASTSPAVSVSVAASSLISTSTKISASATSIKQGASVSFTATVTASTGTAKPTGTVVFHNGSTTLGSVALNSSGTAVYSTTTLPVGTASITASYGGSSTNSASTSPAVSVSVAGSSLVATTTTLKASSISVPVGTTVTLTATVVHPSGSAVPTGTVTFYNGSAVLGSSSLNTSGVATYTGSSASAGTFTVTASYGGSSTYATSTSPAVIVTIGSSTQTSTTTTLKSSATSISKGVVVTFTAAVAHSSSSAVPTGTVTFYNGSAVLGSGALNSSAVATFSASSASTGTFTITARYGGNSAYVASTSSAVIVTVK